MAETYLNLIDGRWVPARSGRTFETRNPAARNEILGVHADSDEADVNAAVASARRAYDEWRLVPPPRRAEVVARAASLLAERKEDLARLMTREMGKILPEARGDVQEAVDCGVFAAGEGRRLHGDTTPSELPSKFAMSIRMPVGVCAAITPWNFPMAIPSWKIFPALVAGNAVVLKPAQESPAVAAAFVQALLDAGLPPGVLNFITGSGPRAGQPLAVHPDVRVVSFTGSTAVGRTLARLCGDGLKRLSLELGGKNAQIVLEDADLDLAREGALWGAFGTTGQRCTATSRLILHRTIASAFTAGLIAGARALRLGDGLDPDTQVGPLVSDKQRTRVASYVEIGRAEGAEILCGGRPAAGGGLDRGFFFEPTVFGNVKPSMRIAQEEIFGPVLAVLVVDSFEEAIHVLNDTPYGLSSSIYTRDVNRAMRAVRDIEAGITYVNGPTIGAEVHLPFGGVKQTGNGHREASHTVLDVFTEWKSVYIDYSGRLQRAQIDNH